MRLQVTDQGTIRATVQPRADGTQSRTHCCDNGHPTLEEAARHGLDLELADELAAWEAMPQPVIVTGVDEMQPVPDEPDLYRKVTTPVDPYVTETRQVNAFDKRELGDSNYPHITLSADGTTIAALDVQYRVVHEGAAVLVGVRVGDAAA